MKFEIGDKVHMYNWQTAHGIMRALGRDDPDFVYGISKESWNKWKNADDLTIEKIQSNHLLEAYSIRSASLDVPCSLLLWTVPAVCMYKKERKKAK